MKIGIIGAGKLGCAFALGLKEKGYDISGVYSKSAVSAQFLNNLLGMAFENNLNKTVQASDVLFITIPDSEIENVAVQIADFLEPDEIVGKHFLHCSGALTSEVLTSISRLGGFTGSLHPIQTFAERENGWKGLESTYFGFEGCSKTEIIAAGIIKRFNGKIIIIDKENKPVYHAAACMLSNYMVTLSHAAFNMLGSIGICENEGIKAFSPLIDKTLENIKGLGTVMSLTGPISRGDSGVIEGHINSMKKKCPQELEVYKTLGNKTIELALEKGSIGLDQAEQVRKAMDN